MSCWSFFPVRELLNTKEKLIWDWTRNRMAAAGQISESCFQCHKDIGVVWEESIGHVSVPYPHEGSGQGCLWNLLLPAHKAESPYSLSKERALQCLQ